MSDDEWYDDDDDAVGGSGHGSSGGGGFGAGAGLLIFGIGALVGFVAKAFFSGRNRERSNNQQHSYGQHSSGRGGFACGRATIPSSANFTKSNEEEHMKKRKAGRKVEAEFDKCPNEVKCIVCYANEREVVLFPCRHTCICVDCSKKVNKCPYCSSKIEDIKVTYFP